MTIPRGTEYKGINNIVQQTEIYINIAIKKYCTTIYNKYGYYLYLLFVVIRNIILKIYIEYCY